MREAIILFKPSITPVQRDYWKNEIGKPHTISGRVVLSHCGSVLVHLIPTPKGIVIISAPVLKKLLLMVGWY
jgi:small subunit ribosomal protein S2e